MLESIAQRTSEEVNDNGGTSSSTYFRLLSGRSVVKTWRDLLERSESQVVRVWSPQGIEMSYSNGFVDDFKKAVERGVRIRGVVEMTLHNSSACSAFSSVMDLRYIRSLKDSLRYELVDDTNIAISLVDFKELKGQLEAISTNNRVIVRGFKSHFEHLWSQAIPHQFESNK